MASYFFPSPFFSLAFLELCTFEVAAKFVAFVIPARSRTTQLSKLFATLFFIKASLFLAVLFLTFCCPCCCCGGGETLVMVACAGDAGRDDPGEHGDEAG